MDHKKKPIGEKGVEPSINKTKQKIAHSAVYFKPVVMFTLILALKLAFTLTLMLPLILNAHLNTRLDSRL